MHVEQQTITMHITNYSNLPEAVYKVIAEDEYTKGDSDYSATTLLKPPQQVILQERYKDKLQEDALDRVWSLFGKACHHLLEKHGAEDALTEERLYIKVKGKQIGGQVDSYHQECVTDYKITSAWTLVYGSRIHEWEEQLNIYAYIFRQNGYTVNSLQIVAILRDWDKNKAKQNKDYPKAPIEIIPITVWPDEKCKDFIYSKVTALKKAEKLPDKLLAELLPCTKEDMWEQDSKYAVMKEGRKAAVRVLDTREAANTYILDNCPDNWDKDGHSKDLYNIVTRVGRRTRCEDYCVVKDFCQQYKKYREELDVDKN